MVKVVMRVGYIAPGFNVWKDELVGVSNKIHAQVKAFDDAGFETDVVSADSDDRFMTKMKRRIPFMSDGFDWSSIDASSYDALYIRRPNYISVEFLDFLKNARSENDALVIILEIPTYPYDNERKTLKSYPVHLKDRLHRKKLAKYVDRIADLSGAREVFGIPTIHISNGIDMDRLSARAPRDDDGSFVMVCAASFSLWHGIDRLLVGMSDYYSRGGSKAMLLHLAGEGPEQGRLKSMVSELSLSERVMFHGMCDQDALDRIYAQSDVGIASLGLHRIGIESSSTLKSREYLAKGIPFVYSGEIDVFQDEPVDFCFQAPSDDSAVNMGQIVEYFETIRNAEPEKELIERIRGYAESHVSVQATMSNVTDYLRERCED